MKFQKIYTSLNSRGSAPDQWWKNGLTRVCLHICPNYRSVQWSGRSTGRMCLCVCLCLSVYLFACMCLCGCSYQLTIRTRLGWAYFSVSEMSLWMQDVCWWCAAAMFVMRCALSALERCQQPSLHTGFVTVFSLELRSVGRGFKSYSRQRCKLFTPMCLCQSKQYNLVRAKGQWCCVAGEVTAGLAESNGSLPPGVWLTVTCGLTACTLGSAPGPTLGIEYVKSLPFFQFDTVDSSAYSSPT